MKRFAIVALLTGWTAIIYSQSHPELLNSRVRYGKLENGMTYYIMHNEEPRGKSSYYMVHNVGAVLEEDHQNGLAHMLEHMAFNGSTHFPGKGLKNFLERNGVEFGKSFNAYTSLDETVYNISHVPTQDPVVMDSCVWILHDWSGSLTLAEEEIDAERGVILEEWRTRNNAQRRSYKQLMPVWGGDTPYGKRDVIGEMDVVLNSDYEAIKSFYRKWYRPDLQAAIIVGDFDVDEMEERVRRILSLIPRPENPAYRKEFEVQGNSDLIFAIARDKELGSESFTFLIKHPATAREKKTRSYLEEVLKRNLVNGLLNRRLGELTQDPETPYRSARASYSGWYRKNDRFTVYGSPKESRLSESLEAIFTEIERARRHGFVESELERLKSDNLAGFESSYKKRDKISNDAHAKSLQMHFLTGEPRPGIEYNYEFARELYARLTVEDLNDYLDKWITEENRIFTMTGPDSEEQSYLSKEELFAIIQKIEQAEIEPYTEVAGHSALIPGEDMPPSSGTVIQAGDYQGISGTKLYTLENGAEVVLYPTDKTAGEVLLRGISEGGSSLLEQDLLHSAKMFSPIDGRSGIGNYNRVDLRKVLSGKRASVSFSLGELNEYVIGSADTDDLEYMFQLLYLKFRQPRFDRESYDILMENKKQSLASKTRQPASHFSDSLSVLMTDYHARNVLLNTESIEKVSFEHHQRIYAERFNSIGDFTFFIVGDFREEIILPFIEKYIGGLSGDKGREHWIDHRIGPSPEKLNKHYRVEMANAKLTNVLRFYSEEYDYNAKNNLVAQIAASVLKVRYYETMREEEGGTYGASVSAMPRKVPSATFALQVKFDCAPSMGEKLREIAIEEVKDLREQGADPVTFANSKEAMLKAREKNLEQNGYILNNLVSFHRTGINFLNRANYEDILNDLTLVEFNSTISKILSEDKLRVYEVVMMPEEEDHQPSHDH